MGESGRTAGLGRIAFFCVSIASHEIHVVSTPEAWCSTTIPQEIGSGRFVDLLCITRFSMWICCGFPVEISLNELNSPEFM